MNKELSYAESQQKLQTIMDRFESGEHKDVEEMLKDYEAATDLISRIESQIQNAEVTLRKLKAK